MLTTQISWNYLDSTARATIEDLMDGDAEMIADLVDTLILSSPELLKEIENGLQIGNAKQVREAAHALKSSNAQLGALGFSEMCAEMELKGKMEDMANADLLYTKILEEFEKVESALISWKEHLISTSI
ncbi:MAG: Hpt domain-containing protein [Bacteroidia bacterium]